LSFWFVVHKDYVVAFPVDGDSARGRRVLWSDGPTIAPDPPERTNDVTILTPELLASFDDSVGPVNEAQLLPPSLYTSDEFYAFEREAIFGREWLAVGRVAQFKASGDFRCITIAGEPLLVVLDANGKFHVLSAVCQHRGMVLAEGTGNCRRFTCPYHHWSYGLDGQLLGAPAMDHAVGFDLANHGLPDLKVEIWQGFIMANFDLDAKPLGPTLTKIDALLENYDLDSTVTLDGAIIPDLEWNWKVMLENFNDPYHASRLHGPLQTFAPSHMNDFLPWDDDDGAIGRIQHFTHMDASFNPTKRSILPVFSSLTKDQRKRGGFVLIPPTLALAIVPDEVAYFIISPRDVGHITINIGYCFEPTSIEDPMFEYLFQAAETGVNNFNVQDIYADKMIQKGLNSRSAPRGRYSWQEETLVQFNRWLVKRYRSHWPTN
jgi:phenylpropionate dioxygenase-like ring-hydroxylating dioxygenase large terminal subunit